MRPGAHINPTRLMDAIGYAAGAPFAIAAAIRGGKAVHPRGEVFEATIAITGEHAPPAATLLAEPREHRALVRFSRSFGFPKPLPDLLGMSIRLPDVHGPGRHQDFMLVTSVDLPILHHGFLPAGHVQQRPYSSSLPYRAGEQRFLIGALPAGDGRFELAVAPMMGRFRPVGEIRIGARLPQELDAIQMNPFNTGGGLRPAGFLNRLRDYAYPLSQAGRRARGSYPRPPSAASASSTATSSSGSGVAR